MGEFADMEEEHALDEQLKKEFGAVMLVTHGKLTPKQEREAARYQIGCEELTVALLRIAEDRDICPWCLLLHTTTAALEGMEDGQIDHEQAIVEHP